MNTPITNGLINIYNGSNQLYISNWELLNVKSFNCIYANIAYITRLIAINAIDVKLRLNDLIIEPFNLRYTLYMCVTVNKICLPDSYLFPTLQN